MPLGIVKNPPPLLIIMAGESNAGGLADNSEATASEVATRSIKILNNTTLTSFSFLNIGTNNLTGHVGLIYAENDAHGWELQIANRKDDGDFGARAVYLVKAGQGGTVIAEWADEATYNAESQTIEPYDVFIARVRAAINIVDSIHNRMPDVIMLWSIGINDAGIGTTTGTYKTAVKAVFNLMRTDIGIDFPIIQTQFQSINTVYDAVINDITNEMTDVYAINTTGAETTQVFAGAGSHWGYTGMKQIADDMIDLILSIF